LDVRPYNRATINLMQSLLSKPFTLAAILAMLALIGYGGYRHSLTVNEFQEAKQNFSENKAEFENRIKSLEDEITQAKIENNGLTDELTNEKVKNNFLEEQVRGFSSTISILENLNKTDRELLKKYSKTYFLNENYKPSSLTDIDSKYLFKKDEVAQIHSGVWPFLKKMLESADADNTPLQIISSYRSFGTQANLKSGYIMTYGAGTANQFSADQGYSEHQLGTAVDFTTPSLGASFVKFESAAAYKWLNENAHKYGFIISYPKQNTYYRFEPWHWRFVGVDLAAILYSNNKYFYDLDQRVIDLYLISLFK